MRDRSYDDYDYGPNELAELSINNKEKYERIVKSNLQEGDSIEQWQQRNRQRMQSHLKPPFI